MKDRTNKRIQPMTSSAVCQWLQLLAVDALLVMAHPWRLSHSETMPVRTHRTWLDAGIYLVSVFLACIVVWYVLPPDYRGGRGAVAVMVPVLALILKFLLSLIVDRMSREE